MKRTHIDDRQSINNSIDVTQRTFVITDFLLIVNWSGPKRDKLTPSHAKKLANGPRRFAHSPPDIIVPILGTAKFSSRIFKLLEIEKK